MPVFPGPKTGINVVPSSMTLDKVKFKLASRLTSAIVFSVLT